MKLLIIEDDDEISSFLKYVLEDESYEVAVAASAFEARLALKEGKPDLVILDRGLPDQDGLELCRELKSSELASVPVLFLSASKKPTDIVDGFSSGGDDYVTKPFAFMELLARVQALLRKNGDAGYAH